MRPENSRTYSRRPVSRSNSSRRSSFGGDSTRNQDSSRSSNTSRPRFRDSRGRRSDDRRRNFSQSRGNRFRGVKLSQDVYIAKAVEGEMPQLFVEDMKYTDFELHPIIKANIASKHYIHPTKIQAQAIPHILDGRDVLGLASTGSGKTAAFLLPLIDKAIDDRSQRCLIICPTRELAGQIQEEFISFAKGSRLREVLIIGGASMNKQISFLRRNPEFIIGTPGRLRDLVEQGVLKLGQCNNIVLDEVDRMLDMGFINDIRFLVEQLGNEKQSLFFSATMTREAEEIANTLLYKPMRIQVEKQEAHKNVDQDVVKVSGYQNKIEVLQNLLSSDEYKKFLVFTRTKSSADRVSKDLYRMGFNVDSIHGDKSQFKRNKVIERFKNDRIEILIATDVAARGLDIHDVTHVINFDEPANFDDYIHRIGRTGRAGKKGKAVTFVD